MNGEARLARDSLFFITEASKTNYTRPVRIRFDIVVALPSYQNSIDDDVIIAFEEQRPPWDVVQNKRRSKMFHLENSTRSLILRLMVRSSSL